MDLYAGTTMNVKKPTTIMGFICGHCNECKKISNYFGTYMWVLHI